MSNISMPLNTKNELASWCRRLGGMFAADLAAIDEAQYGRCQGGVTRSVADMSSEVAGFCMMVAGGLRGEPMEIPGEDVREAFKKQFENKEFAMKTVKDGANALADALDACSDETLASSTTAPWGETMTTFALANIAINHILYHDGQLNYIQALHGDGEMHWFDA